MTAKAHHPEATCNTSANHIQDRRLSVISSEKERERTAVLAHHTTQEEADEMRHVRLSNE